MRLARLSVLLLAGACSSDTPPQQGRQDAGVGDDGAPEWTVAIQGRTRARQTVERARPLPRSAARSWPSG